MIFDKSYIWMFISNQFQKGHKKIHLKTENDPNSYGVVLGE